MKPTPDRAADCRACVHFDDDPASIERALPGINALGSAYGSVRGNAGICAVRRRFMEPVVVADCADFRARPRVHLF